MVCCLLCFDGSPMPGDQRAMYGNQWNVSMMDSCGVEPGCCIASFCFLPCAQVLLRQEALNNEMEHYKCCQGYYDNACFRAGSCGDKGNTCCLVCEAVCCTSCAVSASRQLVMDTRNIVPDPCDNQIIRFSNFMQLLACVCDIVGIFWKPARHLAHTIEHIAHLVYLGTAACMTAQAHHEIKMAKQEGQVVVLEWGNVSNQHVVRQQMKRGEAPQQQQQQQQYQQQQQQPQYQQGIPVANPVAPGQTPYVAMGDQQQHYQQQQQQQQQQQPSYQQAGAYVQPPPQPQGGYPGQPQGGYPGAAGEPPHFDPVTGAPLNQAAFKMRGGQ